jgi:hypothetical protein
VQDAGSADTHEYRFDCGSGYGQWGSASSTSCAAGDGPGSLTVNGEVRDDDGGISEYTGSVSVNNVAPTATKSFDSSVNEGSSFNLALTNPTDPSSADTAAGFTYAFDCGSGYGAFGSSSSTSCATNDNGTRSVGAKIRDKDGGVTEYTDSVTVNNVAPVVGALSVTDPKNGVACLGGNAISLGFSFNDAGSADTHGYSIAWGDGSANTVVNSATSPVANVGHTYSSPGTYTITVTVTDDDSGSGSNTKVQSFRYNLGTTLLSPVNADSTSIFKLGSTIPLKINITDCNGTGVSGLSPTIKMLMISSNAATTGEIEAISTQPNDTNGLMRDLGNGQYIYNLASGSLPDSSAKYKANITSNGYTVTSQNYFSLKAK